MNAQEITFGIEIETTIPRGAVVVGGYHAPTQAQGLPEGWSAKTDSSIQPARGREGCEFVSPVLKGSDGIRSVIAALEALHRMNASVNQSTGFHVHVGWQGDEAALNRLVTLVANFERGIFATTGTRRRERAHWCASIRRHGSAQAAAVQSRCNRYHVLNLNNLETGRRQTVEFRAFPGTLNLTKVIGYIRLCVGLVERAVNTKRTTNFTAKAPVATSPIHRSGEGQTELTRLFYQLGWTKGRTSYTYGDLNAEGAPNMRQTKKELMRLARKYDSET